MKFQFSNVVVVDDGHIGVVVKSWANNTYDVYVRSYNKVMGYQEGQMKHFVYDKELRDDHHE